jgi:ribosome modulation factor
MMINSKAWLEGKLAGEEGVPEFKNPYRGGADFQSWLDGWKAGLNNSEQKGRDNA